MPSLGGFVQLKPVRVVGFSGAAIITESFLICKPNSSHPSPCRIVFGRILRETVANCYVPPGAVSWVGYLALVKMNCFEMVCIFFFLKLNALMWPVSKFPLCTKQELSANELQGRSAGMFENRA